MKTELKDIYIEDMNDDYTKHCLLGSIYVIANVQQGENDYTLQFQTSDTLDVGAVSTNLELYKDAENLAGVDLSSLPLEKIKKKAQAVFDAYIEENYLDPDSYNRIDANSLCNEIERRYHTLSFEDMHAAYKLTFDMKKERLAVDSCGFHGERNVKESDDYIVSVKKGSVKAMDGIHGLYEFFKKELHDKSFNCIRGTASLILSGYKAMDALDYKVLQDVKQELLEGKLPEGKIIADAVEKRWNQSPDNYRNRWSDGGKCIRKDLERQFTTNVQYLKSTPEFKRELKEFKKKTAGR